MPTFAPRILALFVAGTAVFAQAEEIIHVQGRSINLIGDAVSASEGVVGQQEIQIRPRLRTGEVLELIPGMIVTQHSGTGKANQYFLRGFNLDHGTDFATYVDNMPVNMRSHGHGQGYTDLNFVIPEAIEQIRYDKGAYRAQSGDFSAAGRADLRTAWRPEHNQVSLTLGEDDYGRLVALAGTQSGETSHIGALEVNRYQGPWSDIDEDLDKINALYKLRHRVGDTEWGLGLMAYDNSWNSADQIPRRAVTSGLIDEYGSIDTTVGGNSSRYSLNLSVENAEHEANVYAIRYDMQLWSNFTYFLDDETNGDQFEQVDERWIYGGHYEWTRPVEFMGIATENTLGSTFRYDDIAEVGLYSTQDRQRLGVTRSDSVEEGSIALFWQNEQHWSETLRSTLVLRYDYYTFDVAARVDENRNGVDMNANAGNGDEGLTSVRANIVKAFSDEWEGYASWGQSFHSNDARGVTTTLDPASGDAVDPVTPLVRSEGYELGLRGFPGQKLNTSVALWYLSLDSELLFVGDAGTTEASDASERYGLELTAYYFINDVFTLDAEYAWTNSEWAGGDYEGQAIPGSIEHVLQAGVSAKWQSGWQGSLRARYFSDRPLDEDNTIYSDSSTIINAMLGYHTTRWGVDLEVLNLLDSSDHDIDYYYASRLANEAPGSATDDIHYHVFEPQTLRLTGSLNF